MKLRATIVIEYTPDTSNYSDEVVANFTPENVIAADIEVPMADFIDSFFLGDNNELIDFSFNIEEVKE